MNARLAEASFLKKRRVNLGHDRKTSPLVPKSRYGNLPSGSPEAFQACASLSVIFPVFNEEANISRTVELAQRILPELAKKWEIILVDDGSKDATTAMCDQFAAQCPGVRAIHHQENKGYGAALKSGILAARHDLIFFSDADGQFDLQELRQLIQWSSEYDMVLGYRGKRQDPPHRLLNALGWNILVRLVLGVTVRDIDCAFKLFHRSVFDRVQIRSVGAMVNTEILAQAMRLEMRMHEVEVSHFPRRHGKSSGANLRVILKALRELLRLRRKLRNVTNQQTGLYANNRQLDLLLKILAVAGSLLTLFADELPLLMA